MKASKFRNPSSDLTSSARIFPSPASSSAPSTPTTPYSAPRSAGASAGAGAAASTTRKPRRRSPDVATTRHELLAAYERTLSYFACAFHNAFFRLRLRLTGETPPAHSITEEQFYRNCQVKLVERDVYLDHYKGANANLRHPIYRIYGDPLLDNQPEYFYAFWPGGSKDENGVWKDRIAQISPEMDDNSPYIIAYHINLFDDKKELQSSPAAKSDQQFLLSPRQMELMLVAEIRKRDLLDKIPLSKFSDWFLDQHRYKKDSPVLKEFFKSYEHYKNYPITKMILSYHDNIDNRPYYEFMGHFNEQIQYLTYEIGEPAWEYIFDNTKGEKFWKNERLHLFPNFLDKIRKYVASLNLNSGYSFWGTVKSHPPLWLVDFKGRSVVMIGAHDTQVTGLSHLIEIGEYYRGLDYPPDGLHTITPLAKTREFGFAY